MQKLLRRLGFEKRSVFMMVISLFFLMTIPIYIMGFGTLRWGHRTIEEQMTYGLRADLEHSILMLESEMERIRMLQFECLNDEDLFYTVNAQEIMTPYERTRALLTMQHRLSVMWHSSAYIEDVRVYLTAIDRMVSARDGVSAMTDEWKPILYAKEDATPSQLTYYDGQMYLCASYPIISPDESAVPLYSMIILFREDMLRSLLSSANGNREGGVALVAPSSGYALTARADDAVAARLAALDNPGAAQSRVVEDGDQKYLVVQAFSDYLGMRFYSYVSKDTLNEGLAHYERLCLALFIVMLAVALVFSAGSYYLIRRPMRKLLHSLQRLEKGELDVRITHSLNDEYTYLYETFNSMAAALQNLIEMNYKQRLLTQEAEMKQLQAQINPHFLYNSFFILYRMTQDEDYDRLSEFLHYLSDYYRFITRNARSEVALRDELKHAENYARIQEIRFSHRLRVELDALPESVQGLRVPRLILQPVLENAFGHGLRDVTENGLLRVSFREEEDSLFIDVENNGPAVPDDTLQNLRAALSSDSEQIETTALVNIHRRLRLKFGPDSGVQIEHGGDGGLRVTLVIRLKKESKGHVSNSGG